MAITCRKCEDAPCVAACPKEDVLVQRPWDGLITVNEEECNGCGWCIEACDFGAITLHPEKKVAMVCDLCGGEPECVKFCAHGVFKTVENPEKRKPIVIKPDACVVFCTSCGKACPTDAITFPPKKEVRDIIQKLRNGET